MGNCACVNNNAATTTQTENEKINRVQTSNVTVCTRCECLITDEDFALNNVNTTDAFLSEGIITHKKCPTDDVTTKVNIKGTIVYNNTTNNNASTLKSTSISQSARDHDNLIFSPLFQYSRMPFDKVRNISNAFINTRINTGMSSDSKLNNHDNIINIRDYKIDDIVDIVARLVGYFDEFTDYDVKLHCRTSPSMHTSTDIAVKIHGDTQWNVSSAPFLDKIFDFKNNCGKSDVIANGFECWTSDEIKDLFRNYICIFLPYGVMTQYRLSTDYYEKINDNIIDNNAPNSINIVNNIYSNNYNYNYNNNNNNNNNNRKQKEKKLYTIHQIYIEKCFKDSILSVLSSLDVFKRRYISSYRWGAFDSSKYSSSSSSSSRIKIQMISKFWGSICRDYGHKRLIVCYKDRNVNVFLSKCCGRCECFGVDKSSCENIKRRIVYQLDDGRYNNVIKTDNQVWKIKDAYGAMIKLDTNDSQSSVDLWTKGRGYLYLSVE